MVGPVAKPQHVPRPSSGGLREALKIIDTIKQDPKLKSAKELLENMLAVQEQNERVF